MALRTPMVLRTPHAHHAFVRRLLRYGSVSAVSTVTSLVVLGLLVGLVGFPAIWANVIATAVGTVPSFELNRRWVWAQSGRRALLRQALPYILLSFAGLIISTAAVHLASDATAHATRLVHTVAVELANITAYGALWIVQFVLCDRVLFRPDGREPTALGDPFAVAAAAPTAAPPAAEPGESSVGTLVEAAHTLREIQRPLMSDSASGVAGSSWAVAWRSASVRSPGHLQL